MDNESSSQDTGEIHSQVLPAGYALDEYSIEKEIGSGGFGVTYRARDKHLDRVVAIKEYFPFNLASRASSFQVSPKTRIAKDVEEYQWGLDRFIDEARVLAHFEHPNIIRVIRYIEKNSTAYIIMDYAQGRDLATVLQSENPLSVERVKDIVLPIAEGLINVHSAQMLHRDIKPGNIRIKDNGTPVLIDFGAARQAIGARSKSISTILTPGYAPIEQYSSRGNQGPWTDIYALAAVAYVCLTHESLSHFEATERIRGDRLPKLVDRIPNSDHAFLAALDWALQPDEQQRPQSVSAWLQAMTHPGSVSNTAIGNDRTQAITSVSTSVKAEPSSMSPATESTGYDVFISYASPDKETAFRFCEELERRNIRCWIAPRNVRAGKEYTEEIIRGLDRAQHMVLMLSQAANQSIFVKREVERAISYNKPVFPVRIEDVMPAPSLELLISSSHWIDAWAGKLDTHIDQLARDLNDDDEAPLESLRQHDSARVGNNASANTNTKSRFTVGTIAIAIVGLGVAGVLAYMAMTLSGNERTTTLVNPTPESQSIEPSAIESPASPVVEPQAPTLSKAQPKTSRPAPDKTSVVNPNQVQDRQDFERAKIINTPEAFELYLRLHPSGDYRKQARQYQQRR